MGRYEFDSDNSGGLTVGSLANTAISAVVRLAGLALLAVGLWTAITIIQEAWALYQNPESQRVEAIARAIDEGSHLDKALSPKRLSPAAAAGNDTSADDKAEPARADAAKPAETRTSSEEQLRLSYFVAWAILLMLLLLIGRLSIAAIKTGGELALYDVQIKRFAGQLLREVARERRGE